MRVTCSRRGRSWSPAASASGSARIRPKAFVSFAGSTLVAAALEVLEEHPAVDGIVCVVPEGWEERATILADDLCAMKIACMVAGGASRAESVRNGLDCPAAGARGVRAGARRRCACSSTRRWSTA